MLDVKHVELGNVCGEYLVVLIKTKRRLHYFACYSFHNDPRRYIFLTLA